MPKPVLYIFAMSHYCEKAGWALDYLDIDYKSTHVAPGIHRRITKQLGAPRSSLPILVADGQTVQGLSTNYRLGRHHSFNGFQAPDPNNAHEECLEIEIGRR